MKIPTRLDTLTEQLSIIQLLLKKASQQNNALAQAKLSVKMNRVNKEIRELQSSDDRSAIYSTKPMKKRAERQEIGI